MQQMDSVRFRGESFRMPIFLSARVRYSNALQWNFFGCESSEVWLFFAVKSNLGFVYCVTEPTRKQLVIFWNLDLQAFPQWVHLLSVSVAELED